MLILKIPSCKVHISECHQPHWVTPCQLDLPVEFKNSHLICLFIRHASILPNTQKFLQESRFSGYYRGYVGSQKTMTTSSVAFKKKEYLFHWTTYLSNYLPKRSTIVKSLNSTLFQIAKTIPTLAPGQVRVFFPSPNRIHSNLYQTKKTGVETTCEILN